MFWERGREPGEGKAGGSVLAVVQVTKVWLASKVGAVGFGLVTRRRAGKEAAESTWEEGMQRGHVKNSTAKLPQRRATLNWSEFSVKNWRA